jgi:Mn-containing catalase
MPSTPEHSFLTDLKFFDLLLEQFSGYEGELTMAIAYLTQAADDTDPVRRETLIRIARQKIKHADILRMILLQIAQGRATQTSEDACLNELASYLIEQGMKTRRYEARTRAWPSAEGAEQPLTAPRYAGNPKNYLEADVACEAKQVAVYRRLVSLTSNAIFISALGHLRRAQKQHRIDLLELLNAIDR